MVEELLALLRQKTVTTVTAALACDGRYCALSPLAGRGHLLSFNKLGWVRGKGKPLTHSFLLKLLSSPLPANQRGEGTTISAAFL